MHCHVSITGMFCDIARFSTLCKTSNKTTRNCHHDLKLSHNVPLEIFAGRRKTIIANAKNPCGAQPRGVREV